MHTEDRKRLPLVDYNELNDSVHLRYPREMFIRRLLPLFLLALLFLSGVGSSTGLVMCYGADGHVAIELAGDNDCRDLVQQIDPAQERQHNLVSKQHCGKCTDIPLMFQSSETVPTEQATFSLDIKTIYLSTPWEMYPTLFLGTATEGRLPQPPPTLDPFLKVHRTIVLLI